jgi:subtilisin family serine protease/N-acetylneuraminic acid mutarotase
VSPSRVVAVLAAIALSLGVLPALAGPAAPAAGLDPDGGEKIRPKLERRLDAHGAADFWVRFDERPDLSRAEGLDDWSARGAAVVKALRDAANASQADVRARLDTDGVDYESFWATNAIYVPDGSADLAAELASEPSVAGLYPTRTYEVPELSPEQREQAAETVEWGIRNIKADQVWQQYDDTGAGIVVANIDTGVQYDHPALVGQYRGNNGDGTFTHDYNWFDASDTCDGVPCDEHGHGTHTMGTMVGDDGVGNHVGVAPGARWIAANGCATCTDEALIESGQWLLAPTRTDGTDPDPAMRPNIVNNSWGYELPSTDPFMQDITDAWAAAGIFGVWSNGNLGPTCDTASTPGSRTSNYSVGAYDAGNSIADFSSRGVGQDGETKPNLSAPGVDVRSSIPGNGYGVASGTSMAAPHVAGTVALLWSAAPALLGDVDATRDLLDGSATDAPDTECGGTDDDNNVYGEGRLDALALIDAAPVQDTGTLNLHAVDAGSGDPIGGARIAVSGPVSRERVTGADGTYRVALPAGDYAITASAFGYADLQSTATVVSDQTTALDLSMRATPRVRLSGRVTDGSGQGWPLYAQVSVHGVPAATTYTDPDTGRYAISLPAEASYAVTATPQVDGYQPVTADVSLSDRDTGLDLTAPAVLQPSCVTPGYGYHYEGLGTDLAHGLPPGWTTSDENGSGHTWRFGDAFENGLGEPVTNMTGGAGAFAFAQSPGLGVSIDTSITTPSINLSGVDQPVIGFRQHFTTIVENAEVELSLDGGASWETVLHQDRSARGPRETVVPIPQAAGRSQVQVRFRYFPARFSSVMWQLDDIYVGRRTCGPVEGGLVVGNVRDANTGRAVNGVRVADAADPDVVTQTIATPRDPENGDGFFSLFVPGPGRHRLAASAHEYRTHTRQVNIRSGQVAPTSYSLTAGELQIQPNPVVEDVRRGRSSTEKVTLRNTGSAPVTVRLSEQSGLSPQLDSGSLTSVGKVVRVEGDFSPLAFDGHGPKGQVPEAPASPWVELGDYPTRIMDNAVAEEGGTVYSVGGVDGIRITNTAYRYEPASRTWTAIAPLPDERESAAAAVIDGLLYVATGWPELEWASKSMLIYDPASDAWSTGADAPVGVAGAGRAVLDGKLYLVGGCTNACGENAVQRYDPGTDTWDTLAPYPEGRGHLACGALEGQIYCTGGIARTSTQVTNRTYAYDPATDTWTQKADLPVNLWGMAYTASYDRLLVSGGVTGNAVTNQGWIYNPDDDAWAPLPAARHVLYRGGSACGLFRIGGSVGGFTPGNATQMLPTYGACTPEDVPWLSVDRDTLTIPPGRSVRVSLRLAAGDRNAGRYEASVWFKEDTPYLVPAVDVTMRVSGH